MFDQIKNTTVYEQVIQQFKSMILKGSLKKGDKLPSERDLSEKLGVSRTSVREALKALEIIGIVECRQGNGNFIKENFENNLFEPLSTIFLLNKCDPLEILQLRESLETQTAYSAAKNITDEDIKDLEKILKNLDDSHDEIENSKLDKSFHYEIAKISGNFLIYNILQAVSSLMDYFIQGARNAILSKESRKAELSKQHNDILSALKERNSNKALESMRKHLKYVNDFISTNFNK